MVHSVYDITPLEDLIGQGYTVLTPNFRLSRHIKAQWDQRQVAAGASVWEPLAVFPLEAWLQQLWEVALRANLVPARVPLTLGQTLEVWRQVIRLAQSQSADYQLLRPAAAAELANRARDTLLRWQVDAHATQIRSLFEHDGDCQTFLQWLGLFEQRIGQAEQLTLTDCVAQLPALAGQLPSTPVVLVEFDVLPPLFHAVLEVQCTEVKTIQPGELRVQREVHSFSDKRAELQAVASWAATTHKSSDETTIGIVLSDMATERVPLEYLLRRAFDCLGQQYASLPVNFSAGVPLAQVPLVRDALAALGMALATTTVPAVEALLRSRFLRLPDALSALAQRFIRQLYTQGREVVSVSDVRRAANALATKEQQGLSLGACLNALQGMTILRRNARPGVWASRFTEVLSVWGWPGNMTLDTLEYQQLVLWQRTLEEYAGYDLVCDPMPLHEALALLRDCCHRQISQPQSPASAIQVLGPLEAAGLSFDQLWVCGMQGTSWPAPPRPNPLLPIALQTRLQMPHANPEREWAFADALVMQYARSNGTLHASYSRQIGGVADLPSALLQDFTPTALPEPSPLDPMWLADHQQRSIQQLQDHTAQALDLQDHAGVKGGSSLLEDQSQCPFRAFTRHRLGIAPLGTWKVALSPGERGSLLHEALNVVWEELGNHTALHALGEAEEEQLVERSALAAIATIPAYEQRQIGAAYWRLEARRIRTLLREWLVIERQRSAFTVVERELDTTLDIAGLQLKMRVDRVDQLPDGSRVIIDYKSGRSSVRGWFGDRPTQPQLPLYSIAEPEPVAGLAFAQVRSRDCQYLGVGQVAVTPGMVTDLEKIRDPELRVKDWQELNTHWRNCLERLARDFIAGRAQVDPLTPLSCTWCGLQALCRVDYHRTDETDAEGELT